MKATSQAFASAGGALSHLPRAGAAAHEFRSLHLGTTEIDSAKPGGLHFVARD